MYELKEDVILTIPKGTVIRDCDSKSGKPSKYLYLSAADVESDRPILASYASIFLIKSALLRSCKVKEWDMPSDDDDDDDVFRPKARKRKS